MARRGAFIFQTDREASTAARYADMSAIACDGINSAIRKQFFPGEGAPRYSGINMWRGRDALEADVVRRQHGCGRDGCRTARW